jgi:hypothetical protein
MGDTVPEMVGSVGTNGAETNMVDWVKLYVVDSVHERNLFGVGTSAVTAKSKVDAANG